MNTPRRQRGAMALAMAILLIGLISILSVVTVAQYYWAKRDAQKVADMAALSGAQHFNPDCGPDAANAASANAPGNWGETSPHKSVDVACGNWNPATNASAPNHTYFIAPATSTAPANAIKVVAHVTPSTIIPESIAGSAFQINAKAIAVSAQPSATFSVGTTLLKTAPKSTLGRLLGEIGIPLDQNGGTSLVGYDGLAKTHITPAGLLDKLGIPVDADVTAGGLESLLAAKQISAGDLLNAAVEAAGQNQLTSANIDLLNSVLTKLDITSLPPIALGGPDGLFANLVAPAKAAQSAAVAHINAMQVIVTTLWLATREHAVQAKENLDLGPLVVNTTTKVIEPPTIAVGGPGTTAYTAQTRTFLDVTLDTTKVPLLGGLLKNLTGTQIKLHLPIAIDLVGAQATLTDTTPFCGQTDDQGRRLASFHVHSAMLKMCVGNITQANAFSKAKSCDQITGADQDVNILTLKLAGSNLLSLNTHFHTEALTSCPPPEPQSDCDGTLFVGDTEAIPKNGTPLDIGSSVDNLFKALTTALVAKTAQSPGSDPNQSDANSLADSLWDATDHSKSNSTRLSAALTQLQNASTGLQGLLAAPTGQLADILGSTISLNVPGLLDGVGGLLNGVVGAVGNILNSTLCVTPIIGTASACKNVIASTIHTGNTSAYSGSFISKLGLIANLLGRPLDDIGDNILTPLINKTLGLQLGQTDVHLISLQCRSAKLVY